MSSLDSARAVRVLAEKDPAFTEIVASLYGAEPAPDVIWRDVFAKISPGPTDLATPGPIRPPRRRNRAATAAAVTATTVGTVLGVKELGEQLPRALERTPAGVRMFRTKVGWLAPSKAVQTFGRENVPRLQRIPRPGPAARAAGVSAMFGGDLLATHQLRHQDDTQPTVASKSLVGDLADGYMTQARRVVRRLIPVGTGRHRVATAAKDAVSTGRQAVSDSTHNMPRAPGSTGRAQDTGYRAGQLWGQATATPGRKAATYGGLGAAGLFGVHHHNEQQQQQAAPAAWSPGPTPFYYSKRSEREVDVEWSGTFSKFDTDKRLAFGWASVSKMNGLPVIDRQDDIILPEDIEDAVYDYVMHSRVGGDMHLRTVGKTGLFDMATDQPRKVADLVESMLFTDEKVTAMGLPDSFPRGWWIGMRYHDDDVWRDIKEGRRTGFSIHGKGLRTPIDVDELMYAGAVH